METFDHMIVADLLSQRRKVASVDAGCWHDSGEGQGGVEGPKSTG